MNLQFRYTFHICTVHRSWLISAADSQTGDQPAHLQRLIWLHWFHSFLRKASGRSIRLSVVLWLHPKTSQIESHEDCLLTIHLGVCETEFTQMLISQDLVRTVLKWKSFKFMQIDSVSQCYKHILVCNGNFQQQTSF